MTPTDDAGEHRDAQGRLLPGNQAGRRHGLYAQRPGALQQEIGRAREVIAGALKDAGLDDGRFALFAELGAVQLATLRTLSEWLDQGALFDAKGRIRPAVATFQTSWRLLLDWIRAAGLSPAAKAAILKDVGGSLAAELVKGRRLRLAAESGGDGGAA